MLFRSLEVNDYGNAILDENGNFKKVQGKGVTEEIWGEIVAYAESKGYKVGDYKNLNLYFDTRLQSQPSEIRERMVQGVEDFAYSMIVNVLNSKDTAPLAVDAILKAGSFDLGPKASSIEDPAEWTESRIIERAKGLDTNKGPSGNFDD